MPSTEVSVCFEPEEGLYHVELTIDLNLYYEPSDPSVGIMGESWSAEGWENFSEFRIWFNTEPEGAAENWEDWSWEAKTPHEAEVAAAFLHAAYPEFYKKLSDFIDEEADRAAGDYNPEVEYEPPCEYDKYANCDEREW